MQSLANELGETYVPYACGVEVAALRKDEVPSAAWLLARAFDDDPLFCYLFPHQERRARALDALFKYAIRDAATFGRVDAARTENTLIGASIWLPPGAYPPSTARNIRAVPAFLTMAGLFPASLGRVTRTLAADTRAHIETPHWYLEAIGVEPSRQGRGVGTALLQGVLAQADDQDHACYLVTSRPRNLAWYSRLGFEKVATIRPDPASPPFWPMQREAGQTRCSPSPTSTSSRLSRPPGSLG